MARQLPRLLETDQTEPITMETQREFLHHLQACLLLSLQERKWLDVMAYRRASEALNRQRREQVSRLPEPDVQP